MQIIEVLSTLDNNFATEAVLEKCIQTVQILSAANQKRVLRHPIRQPNGIEHPRLSAANQNRILRHPGRQAIRIEHHRLSAANQN